MVKRSALALLASLCVAAAVMLLLAGCGILSAYFLWLAAGFLHVTPQTKLYFVMGMIAAITIGLGEAVHQIIPYYRIKQRLTYGTARWADEVYLKDAALALYQNLSTF